MSKINDMFALVQLHLCIKEMDSVFFPEKSKFCTQNKVFIKKKGHYCSSCRYIEDVSAAFHASRFEVKEHLLTTY